MKALSGRLEKRGYNIGGVKSPGCGLKYCENGNRRRGRYGVEMRICLLGSGSGGNCTLVEAGGFRFLIDAARLPQRYIRGRLAELGTRIEEIDAVIATHVHGDHVDGKVTYPLCRKYDIPLYIHSGSFGDLVRRSGKFEDLERAGLVRCFGDTPFPLRDNLWVRPFHVRHGNGWNVDIVGRPVGFRIHYIDGVSEKVAAYATDLGSVEPHIVEALTGADAVVIESNHDVQMELASRRPKFLVDWVTGPVGHLSNEQAAVLIGKATGSGKTKFVCLAHLSEDCNTPELAMAAARSALDNAGNTTAALCTAGQRVPSPEMIL